MASPMERVHVSLGFVLVLEAVPTVMTSISFSSRMCPYRKYISMKKARLRVVCYMIRSHLSSLSVLNLLGFWGQHSHIENPLATKGSCNSGNIPRFEGGFKGNTIVA